MKYSIQDTVTKGDLGIAFDKPQTNSKRVKLLNKLANTLSKSSPEEAHNYASEALQIAHQIRYQQGIGDSSYLLGKIYWNQGNFKEAENAFIEALEVRERIKDITGTAKSYNALGAIYLTYGVYAKSLEYFIKALKMCEADSDEEEIANCCNNIGIVYEELGDHNKSLEYHQRSLSIRKEINNKIGIAYSYSNTGNIFKIKGEYDKALNYYFKSLEITNQLNDNHGMAHSYSLVGEIYCTLGDNNQALDYLFKALSIQEKLGDKAGKAISLNRIGEVHTRKGKYQKAIDYYQRSLAITRGMNAEPLLESVYKNLANVYAYIKDYQSAFEYHVLFSEARAALFNEEKANAVAQVSSQYEYDKKNQEIQRLNSEQSILREAKDELELFAGKVAHDLKEPLRMMSSFGSLLEDKYQADMDDVGKEYLSIIKNSSVRMQALLSDLLEFALSGNEGEDGKKTDLNDTAVIVKNNLRLNIKESNTKLTINDLPTVNASFSNMVQLFQNLIANAIKFKRNDTDPIIEIDYIEQNKNYVISVKDNGIGIDKKHQEEIFQVFTRLHSHEKYDGTGIGLATCKKIVKNLHGKIWAESNKNEGTTFYISLPI